MAAGVGLAVPTTDAWAEEPSPPAPGACGFALRPEVMAEWVALGGREGRLGCPTGPETAAATSPGGVHSTLTPFGDAGVISTVVDEAGTARPFAVVGCNWRLYFQFGGAGGWLGVPVEDAQNNPDGQTQRFEGGVIRATRAYDSCDAEPAP
jgi:uncharacterized protein with LGFP repeats